MEDMALFVGKGDQCPELYHLTIREDVQMILQNGLHPFLGEQAKLAHEEQPAIYLCEKKDLPYWAILLGKNVALKISGIERTEVVPYQYFCYSEYVYFKDIIPEQISVVDFPVITDSHMRDLCRGYIESISHVTKCMAQYYFYHNKDLFSSDDLAKLVDSILIVRNRLDYSICTEEELRGILVELGESGEYVFTDTYLDTERRLWEQLLFYPEDELTNRRRELYNYIKETFRGCLYTNTGGWTG